MSNHIAHVHSKKMIAIYVSLEHAASSCDKNKYFRKFILCATTEVLFKKSKMIVGADPSEWAFNFKTQTRLDKKNTGKKSIKNNSKTVSNNNTTINMFFLVLKRYPCNSGVCMSCNSNMALFKKITIASPSYYS